MYLIYKHTNIINGKVYIGQTSKENPDDRFQKGRAYNKSPIFFKAIQQYGWDGFTHEILEDNIPTAEEANKREMYWIKYYHSCIYDPECNGYNMTYGGNALVVYQINKDGTIVAQWRTLSDAATTLKLTLGNLSKCIKGKRNMVGGYHWCLKEVYDAGKWTKPVCQRDYSDRLIIERGNKHIYCIETKTQYKSIHEMCRQLNLSRTGVSSALSKGKNTYKGYHITIIK